ncbi:MAG: SRPBCC family protein [Myxococcota bacterium]
MIMLLAGAAFAGTPEVSVRDDGTVVAEVVVAASQEAIHATLADPMLLAKIDGTVQVSVSEKSRCMVVNNTVPHPIATIEYSARACPTADGWTYTMIESEDLKHYSATWQVEKMDEERCTLRYSFRVTPNFPVPQWVVSRQSTQGVRDFLSRLSQHLEQ